MRITVNAKPGSRQNKVDVDPTNSTVFTVHTTKPPDKGAANEAIIKLIAEHFGIGTSKIILVSGMTSRVKVVDVDV